jgi:hypothetical protein
LLDILLVIISKGEKGKKGAPAKGEEKGANESECSKEGMMALKSIDCKDPFAG